MNKSYDIISKKIDLVDYILYLQYEKNDDNITVETETASFTVWDNGCLKVFGEETTTQEFYKMLSSEWQKVSCNGEEFEYVNGKYISVNKIEFQTERFNTVIKF